MAIIPAQFIPQESVRVQSLVARAWVAGAEESEWWSRGYLLAAAVYSVVHGAGFFVRGTFRLVTAVIRFDFSDIPERVVADIWDGVRSWVFAAATACCVFFSIFFPEILGGQTPAMEVPDYDIPLSAALPEDLSHSWVITTQDDMRQILLEPTPRPPASPWNVDRIRALFERHDHSSKWKKYSEALRLYRQEAERLHPHLQGEHPLVQALELLQERHGFVTVRDHYHRYVDLLRLSFEENDETTRSLTRDLCYFRFTGVPIGKYNQELVELASGPLTEELSLVNFWNYFLHRNELLNQLDPSIGISGADRAFQKLQGHANIFFDPTKMTNLPRYLGWMTFGAQRVKVLQHGSPVSQMDVSGILARLGQTVIPALQTTLEEQANAGTRIVSDYLGFLDGCQSRNEKVLHVIVEKKRRQILGDEGGRVVRRMALQERYPDHFIPLALALDGDFFGRRGAYAQIATFAELRGFLTVKMIDPESEYSLPACSHETEETLSALFAEVEAIFFPDHPNIGSKDEYQGYLLLCYTHLIFSLIDRFGISILEIICKDDIDRGNVMKAILFLYFLHLAGRENDPDALRWILINTLAAPLLVKKQGVLADRAEFLRIALALFTGMTPQQKEALRTGRFAHMAAESLDIDIDPRQSVHPFGPTAETEEEYRLFLQHLFSTTSWNFPPSGQNLVEEISQGRSFLLDGQLNEAAIVDQIQRDFSRMTMRIDGQQIDSVDLIKPYLLEHGLSEQEALQVLCCFQQGLGRNLLEHFMELFNNPSLGIFLLADTANDPSMEQELNLHADNGVATIQMVFLSRLIRTNDPEDSIARLGGLTLIPDHRTGIAQYRWLVRA